MNTLYESLKNTLKATLLRTSIGQSALLRYRSLRYGDPDFEAKRAWDVKLRQQIEQSEKESVSQWWDSCHSKADDYSYWLTGSAGPDVWARLKIEDRISPNQTVLNIGVGRGHCTRALSEKGCKVYVLDISPVALASVSDLVEAAWLPSQLEELPSDTFDLAISYLVSQHMTNADLEKQIQEVVRGLKPDGMFAMQFAFRLDGKKTEETPRNVKGGGVCRSLEEMQTLVAGAKGRIVWSERIGTFFKSGLGWYAIHVQRDY